MIKASKQTFPSTEGACERDPSRQLSPTRASGGEGRFAVPASGFSNLEPNIDLIARLRSDFASYEALGKFADTIPSLQCSLMLTYLNAGGLVVYVFQKIQLAPTENC